MKFNLNIDGKNESVDVDEDTHLLWVLRDELGKTGTKFGCGKGLCGACTVHVDGVPKRSCITAASTVTDGEITTIEGINKNGIHPVQQAWMDENVPQCGYCQVGQIMSTIALLDSKSRPSDEEIDVALSGNLCRCGTYPRIKKAIQKLSR
jgi:isoquinoline 1-oxidoreductase alpha subunit